MNDHTTAVITLLNSAQVLVRNITRSNVAIDPLPLAFLALANESMYHTNCNVRPFLLAKAKVNFDFGNRCKSSTKKEIRHASTTTMAIKEVLIIRF